jgi:hypothetical protein
LRTGEGHAGWILQSVARRTATLQKGAQTETLALPKPGTVQAPAPMVTSLPPPPPPPQQRPQSQQLPPPGAAAVGNAPQQQSSGCMPEPVGCRERLAATHRCELLEQDIDERPDDRALSHHDQAGKQRKNDASRQQPEFLPDPQELPKILEKC